MQNITYVENEKINSVLQKYMTKILKKEIKPNFKGSYSYCYECGNFVILRSISSTNSEKQNTNFYDLKRTINKLKSEYNVNTPTLFAEFTVNNQQFVIQERVKGQNLSIYYPHTLKALAYGSYVCDESATEKVRKQAETILPYEEKFIGKFLFNYNNNILGQLVESKQRMFDKYVRDFVLLTKNGVQIDFYRSENFIFSKKQGISFIDLSFNGKNNLKNNATIVNEILWPFKDFLNFTQFMDIKQIETLENKLKKIRKKLYTAIYNNHLISREQYEQVCKKREKKSENGYEL